VYDDGLTDDQAAQLAALADRMRSANRHVVGATNTPVEHPRQDGGPAPGK